MAINQVGRTGFELLNIETYSIFSAFGSVNPSIVDTDPHSGVNHLTWAGAAKPIGWTFTASENISGGCWIKHDGATTGNKAVIFIFRVGGTNHLIQWNMTDNLIEVVDNGGSVVASISDSFMGNADVYNHYGFNCGATTMFNAGWISFYVNGTLAMTYNPGSIGSFTEVYFGGTNGGVGWGTGPAMDDVYLDADVAALDRPPYTSVFKIIRPNSDQSTQWTNSNILQANYTAIDEEVADDDTTYLFESTATGTDKFGFEDPGLAAGHTIRNVTFFMVARSELEPDWWNIGTPIVAYAALGAASYLDSLNDLTGNGHHITTGNYLGGTWTSLVGWRFNGINEYVNVGSTLGAQNDYTIAVRYANCSRNGDYLYGGSTAAGAPFMYAQANVSSLRRYHWGDSDTGGVGTSADGRMIHHEDGCYFNGSLEATFSGHAWASGTTNNIAIGARNLGIIRSGYLDGDILLWAMYDGKLTSLDIATLDARMAAVTG